MGINPDALFLDLQADLLPYLQSEDELSREASSAMVKSFYKKFVDKESPDAEMAAFEKFLCVNFRVGNWRSDVLSDTQRIFLNELKRTLWGFEAQVGLGTLSLNHIYDRMRAGPGASLMARGDDFYTKVFDSPLSCTKDSMHTAYNRIVASNPRWLSAERKRSTIYGASATVEGNSLSFVPKTNEIKRSICTEPNINMMFQLGFGSYIEDGLRKVFGIDLALQPDKNRELARIGSVTGQFGTIDLESASDSLGLQMLRELLPRTVVWWLEYLRSPVTSYRGSKVELKMVSTMGNGFTFPLQTLLFAGVVVTTARLKGISLKYPRNCLGSFGVFGDDIIVERNLYDDVVTNLETLGFVVNRSKSFNDGSFRESCGHDYYHGQNIRGVYCKKLRTVQDRFVLVNRLLDWTARTGIPVRSLVKSLLRTVPFNPVPLGENDDAGIKVPLVFLRRRKHDKHCQSIRYKRWVARPHEIVFKEDGSIVPPKGGKKRRLNDDGAYLAFLQGSIREYRLPVRHDRVRYSKRTGISPNWDMIPMGLGYITVRVGIQALEASYLLNCED